MSYIIIPGNSINILNIIRKHTGHEETMIIINYYKLLLNIMGMIIGPFKAAIDPLNKMP